MSKYGKLVASSAPEPTVPQIEDGTKAPIVVPPKVPSVVPTDTDDYANTIRKAIRWPGKEGANLRLTKDEIDGLKSVIRHFEDKGFYTDRTQLTRIALNYALHDFEKNGDNSILAEVMDRINNW